jgi:hypothetical protein
MTTKLMRLGVLNQIEESESNIFFDIEYRFEFDYKFSDINFSID